MFFRCRKLQNLVNSSQHCVFKKLKSGKPCKQQSKPCFLVTEICKTLQLTIKIMFFRCRKLQNLVNNNQNCIFLRLEAGNHCKQQSKFCSEIVDICKILQIAIKNMVLQMYKTAKLNKYSWKLCYFKVEGFSGCSGSLGALLLFSFL